MAMIMYVVIMEAEIWYIYCIWKAIFGLLVWLTLDWRHDQWLSVVHPCIRPSVRPTVRAPVRVQSLDGSIGEAPTDNTSDGQTYYRMVGRSDDRTV